MKDEYIKKGDPRKHIFNIMKSGANKSEFKGIVNGPASQIATTLLNTPIVRAINKNSLGRLARRQVILNGCGCGGCDSKENLNGGPTKGVKVARKVRQFITARDASLSFDEAAEIAAAARTDFEKLTPAEQESTDVQNFVDQWIIDNGMHEIAAAAQEAGVSINEIAAASDLANYAAQSGTPSAGGAFSEDLIKEREAIAVNLGLVPAPEQTSIEDRIDSLVDKKESFFDGEIMGIDKKIVYGGGAAVAAFILYKIIK